MGLLRNKECNFLTTLGFPFLTIMHSLNLEQNRKTKSKNDTRGDNYPIEIPKDK